MVLEHGTIAVNCPAITIVGVIFTIIGMNRIIIRRVCDCVVETIAVPAVDQRGADRSLAGSVVLRAHGGEQRHFWLNERK
jgi:hypothetical protein